MAMGTAMMTASSARSREGTRGGGGSQAGRRWPGRVAARAGRVPVLLAEEEGDRGIGGGGLGCTVLGRLVGTK